MANMVNRRTFVKAMGVGMALPLIACGGGSSGGGNTSGGVNNVGVSVNNADLEFDVLFGPAYKGITLSCGVAMALADSTGDEVPFAYNRKEVKDHGEGGNMVGAELKGKIAIIDDVITAGTAIRESIALIKEQGAEPSAVFLALDRQELAQKDGELMSTSAIQQVESEYGIPVVAIATMSNLIEFLKQQDDQQENLERMLEYRIRYGIK